MASELSASCGQAQDDLPADLAPIALAELAHGGLTGAGDPSTCMGRSQQFTSPSPATITTAFAPQTEQVRRVPCADMIEALATLLQMPSPAQTSRVPGRNLREVANRGV